MENQGKENNWKLKEITERERRVWITKVRLKWRWPNNSSQEFPLSWEFLTGYAYEPLLTKFWSLIANLQQNLEFRLNILQT